MSTPYESLKELHISLTLKSIKHLPPIMFGIYIDELEAFLHKHIQDNNKCLLHQVSISILLFIDDVVLLASYLEGLQRHLDALSLFCDLRQLMVNLGKTKVMIFNKLRNNIELHLFFRGEAFEITNTYTYLGVKLSGPHLILRPTIQTYINNGYKFLSLLERQCFRHHF